MQTLSNYTKKKCHLSIGKIVITCLANLWNCASNSNIVIEPYSNLKNSSLRCSWRLWGIYFSNKSSKKLSPYQSRRSSCHVIKISSPIMSRCQVQLKISVVNSTNLTRTKLWSLSLQIIKSSNASSLEAPANLSRFNLRNFPNIFCSSIYIVGWVATYWATTSIERTSTPEAVAIGYATISVPLLYKN